MKITVSIWRAVIIDDNVDAFNIDATAKDVCRNEDALLERFKRGVAVDAVELIRPPSRGF